MRKNNGAKKLYFPCKMYHQTSIEYVWVNKHLHKEISSWNFWRDHIYKSAITIEWTLHEEMSFKLGHLSTTYLEEKFKLNPKIWQKAFFDICRIDSCLYKWLHVCVWVYEIPIEFCFRLFFISLRLFYHIASYHHMSFDRSTLNFQIT